MVKYFCSCCNKESEVPFIKLNLNKDVCFLCYNKIIHEAIKKFKELSNSKKVK